MSTGSVKFQLNKKLFYFSVYNLTKSEIVTRVYMCLVIPTSPCHFTIKAKRFIVILNIKSFFDY